MSKLIDLSGKRFGRLVVIKIAGRTVREKHGTRVLWECLCDCGNTVVLTGCALKSGNTQSCGCFRKEQVKNRSVIHGATSVKKEKLYDIWSQMKQRCCNPNNKSYKNYGGRGIKVCNEWVDSYQNFRKWAYNNEYDENAPRGSCTLDRIDNNGDYSPSNCRFTDQKIQNNNRRSNHLLTYNNEMHTITEWAIITGLSFRVIQHRIKVGWSTEKALTTPKLEN